VLAAGVICWVSGFDLIYATQDYDFDRREGIRSLVVKLGIARSLCLAQLLHLLTFAALIAFGVVARLGALHSWPLLLIAAAVDFGRQPVTGQALTDRKRVGVVVVPRQAGGFFVPAERTTHAVHLVCHHCFAVTRTAEHNATVAFAPSYCFRCRSNEKRIIHRFFAEQIGRAHV